MDFYNVDIDLLFVSVDNVALLATYNTFKYKAVVRELAEETGLIPHGEPKFLGIYFNKIASKRDHVVVYRCETNSNGNAKIPDREIAEARFFPIDNLPSDISPATKRRLAEMFEGADVSPHW